MVLVFLIDFVIFVIKVIRIVVGDFTHLWYFFPLYTDIQFFDKEPWSCQQVRYVWLNLWIQLVL